MFHSKEEEIFWMIFLLNRASMRSQYLAKTFEIKEIHNFGNFLFKLSELWNFDNSPFKLWNCYLDDFFFSLDLRSLDLDLLSLDFLSLDLDLLSRDLDRLVLFLDLDLDLRFFSRDFDLDLNRMSCFLKIWK